MKFTFGGASPDHHDHGDAPSGIPLPFTTKSLGSSSGVLELRARLVPGTVIAEALSGDGVAYATAEVALRDEGSAGLARTVRSALSRAVAGLEGPMADSISALILDLGGEEQAVLAEFDIDSDASASPVAVINDALRMRIGAPSGTPIRFGS